MNTHKKTPSGAREHGLGFRLKKYRSSYLLMAPYMILFLLFTVIPVIASILISFTSFDMLSPPKFVGFLNYERMLLDDPIFFTGLKNTLIFAFLTGPLSYLLSFLFAWLIAYAVLTAFKPMEEILIFPPSFYIKNPTADNFLELALMMEDSWVPLSRYIFNSLLISVVGTLGHLLLAGMAAYPLAKIPFPGRKGLKQVVVMSLLFTTSVTYIPMYMVMKYLHLIDTQWSMILPAMQSSLGLYLMMNFMSTLPESLLEAARLDGAGEFRICFGLVMPNVKPAWMTLMIFSFQGLWNATGTSYIYSEQLKMLSAITTTITAGGIARTGVSAAAALLMMLPPILLFVFAQNNVIETMSNSGLKE